MELKIRYARLALMLAALVAVGRVNGYNHDTCAEGRTVIVHLFNWKWTDIAAECERFLAPKGFCGVQVSPVTEHRIVTSPHRPWWERYQPVSYKLETRSGSRAQFEDMVRRCNNVGVHIYVDVIFNHMAGADAGSGIGSGGSYYDTNALDFPGVPYGSDDFNCCYCSECNSGSCDIENYHDIFQVRNCRLLALVDLKLSKNYVRDKAAEHLNDLLAIGVAGFRVDACKHMWPGDIEAVYSRMNNLNTEWFAPGTQPFIFNEVIDRGGEPITAGEYTHLGRVTEFKYCDEIGGAFRRHYPISNLRTIGESWGLLPDDKSLVFIDNHDNQRGHGGGGSNVLTYRDSSRYIAATAFELAHPYAFTRIMSSYDWEPFDADWIGPPHNPDNSIKDVPILGNGQCGDAWVCEHRWRPITNMVMFRNVAKGEPLRHWWDNGNQQIAFARGDKAFIAINNEAGQDLSEILQTGLPEGYYCDVISGEADDDDCTGDIIEVDVSGRAYFYIRASAQDPIIAIHINARSGSGPPPTETTTPGPTTPPPVGYLRTVVFVNFVSQPGQDLFLRGGISHDRRPGCTEDASTSECAVSIIHGPLGSGSHYDKHNSWRQGDNKLNWYGAEMGQGSWQGQDAEGSPTAWTTNEFGHEAYQQINRYGEHHWLFDVEMHCSETENGWFEFKSFVTNYGQNEGWEQDISQVATCGGTAGGSRPYSSTNHFARCGYVNVFSFNSGGCTIDNF